MRVKDNKPDEKFKPPITVKEYNKKVLKE